jgi:hypothetical protein
VRHAIKITLQLALPIVIYIHLALHGIAIGSRAYWITVVLMCAYGGVCAWRPK